MTTNPISGVANPRPAVTGPVLAVSCSMGRAVPAYPTAYFRSYAYGLSDPRLRPEVPVSRNR